LRGREELPRRACARAAGPARGLHRRTARPGCARPPDRNFAPRRSWGRGITLSIPASAKPGIYARLRAVLRAQRLGPAVAGAALLAVLVQIVELLCTSGFPALYTRILTLRQLDTAAYYGYLLLYNLMYMLDDIVVLAIGIVTLSQRRLQEKEGRVLKLVAGLVMLGLGVYLLAPR
jgi:hypothetical protein